MTVKDRLLTFCRPVKPVPGWRTRAGASQSCRRKGVDPVVGFSPTTGLPLKDVQVSCWSSHIGSHDIHVLARLMLGLQHGGDENWQRSSARTCLPSKQKRTT